MRKSGGKRKIKYCEKHKKGYRDICYFCDEEKIPPVKSIQVKSSHDWLVQRVFPGQDADVVNILTTRGNIVTRLKIESVRSFVKDGEKVEGVRRYVSKIRAEMKAKKLNLVFSVSGYSAIREDQI